MTPPPEGPRDAQARAAPDERFDRATVWRELVLATHLLETALERQAQRDGGISHGHFKLLLLLSGAEERTLGLTALADALRFSPSRISHAVNALERQGLLARRPTTGGRRAYEATLTGDGRLVVARVLRAQRREIRDPLLEDLGDLGAVALGGICSRLVQHLDSDRPT